MKLKFSRNQIIVLIIAFVFILYGLVQAIFKFNLNKKTVDSISYVLLIGAFALIFSGRKKNKYSRTQNTVENKEDDSTEYKAEEIIEGKLENIEGNNVGNNVEDKLENKIDDKIENKIEHKEENTENTEVIDKNKD